MVLPCTCFIMSRPFYQYGGHIELVRFKEYYRMPGGGGGGRGGGGGGHEHISFVFSSCFQDIFS